MLLLTLQLAAANIVDLNGFRLSPLILIKKSDFTYSSGSQDEEDYAAVRFDLAMQVLNPELTGQDQTHYALMIIMAD